MIGDTKYKPRRNTPQGQFEKKRAKQRQWEDSVAQIASTSKVIAYADWENKTTSEISKRGAKQRLLGLEAGEQEALLERRRQLANLYNKEMEQWENEVLNSAETMEERKKRILEKATKLRNAREEARRKYIQECYDRQWRDACDDARTLDSKATVDWVASQRWGQLAEKENRRQEEEARDAGFMEKVRERTRFLERQEEEAQARRAERNNRMRRDLDVQVAYNNERRKKLWEASARDDQEELSRLRASIREQEEKERALKEESYARGSEVRDVNLERRKLNAAKAQEEREQELVLLKYAVEKDKAGEDEERAKREEEKKALRQYREYLQEQMVKEAQDEAQYDAVRQREENRIWDQRDAQLKAKVDARKALMEQVHAGRQEQIRVKDLREREQLGLEREQARLAREQFQYEEQRERQKEIAKRQELLDNTARLREQMAESRAKAERLAQEEYLSIKQMEAYERSHKERLQKQAGVVITNHPLKHSQWYT